MDVDKIIAAINKGDELTGAVLELIPGVGALARVAFELFKKLGATPAQLKPFEEQMAEWDALTQGIADKNAEWRAAHPETEPASPDDSQA